MFSRLAEWQKWKKDKRQKIYCPFIKSSHLNSLPFCHALLSKPFVGPGSWSLTPITYPSSCRLSRKWSLFAESCAVCGNSHCWPGALAHTGCHAVDVLGWASSLAPATPQPSQVRTFQCWLSYLSKLTKCLHSTRLPTTLGLFVLLLEWMDKLAQQ
jgi:hypothetical protein